jgi:hypothetical protein
MKEQKYFWHSHIYCTSLKIEKLVLFFVKVIVVVEQYMTGVESFYILENKTSFVFQKVGPHISNS